VFVRQPLHGVASLSTADHFAAPRFTFDLAKYSGDSNFSPALRPPSRRPSTAATTNHARFQRQSFRRRKSVTFTANVSSSVSGTLTGTVNFYLDGGTTPISSASLSSGSAHFSTSSSPPDFTPSLPSSSPPIPISPAALSAPLTQGITDFSISAFSRFQTPSLVELPAPTR